MWFPAFARPYPARSGATTIPALMARRGSGVTGLRLAPRGAEASGAAPDPGSTRPTTSVRVEIGNGYEPGRWNSVWNCWANIMSPSIFILPVMNACMPSTLPAIIFTQVAVEVTKVSRGLSPVPSPQLA